MIKVTRAKSRHEQVSPILAGVITKVGLPAGLEERKWPEIRATLRLCHSSGGGKPRRAKMEDLAKAAMVYSWE